MKSYLKLVCITLFLIGTTGLLAQNSLDYSLNSNVLQIGQETLSTNSVITKTGDILTWVQNNGSGPLESRFTVTGVSENWDINTNSGTINYTLTIENYVCDLALNGTGSGITATLSIWSTAQQQDQYTFTIQSMTYL